MISCPSDPLSDRDGGKRDDRTHTMSGDNIDSVLEAVRKLREQNVSVGENSGSKNGSSLSTDGSGDAPPKRQKLALPERAKPPSAQTLHSLSSEREPRKNFGDNFNSNNNEPLHKPFVDQVPQKIPDRVGRTLDDGVVDVTENLTSTNRAADKRWVSADDGDRATPKRGGVISRSSLHTFSQIQVSRSQTGNPLLEHLGAYQMNSKIKDVDYVINSRCVVNFLSLRYHKLHPEYIYNKIKRNTYTRDDILKVLLVSVDVDDYQDTVRELNKLTLFNSWSLILAWSNEQCAMYLQNLKQVEKEGSKRIIQGSRVDDDQVLANDSLFLERAVETIASIRSISTSDAKALLCKFGSVRGVLEADASSLLAVDGMGDLKTDRLLNSVHSKW